MGTTQRKEQIKMKLEKEIIRLTKLHQNTDKRELIQNINCVLKAQGIHLNRKVKWICKGQVLRKEQYIHGLPMPDAGERTKSRCMPCARWRSP